MFAVWYPIELLREVPAAFNLSFLALVTLISVLLVRYVLTHEKRR